jgi:hypothetical protein
LGFVVLARGGGAFVERGSELEDVWTGTGPADVITVAGLRAAEQTAPASAVSCAPVPAESTWQKPVPWVSAPAVVVAELGFA